MSSAATGALVGGVSCLLASPYLATLTASAPDVANRHWWRGAATDRATTAATAVLATALGVLGGAAAGRTALLPAFVLLALCCAPLTVIDVRLHRLPDRLVAMAAGGGAALLVLAAAVDGTWHPLLRAAEGAAAVFAVLYLLMFVSPRSFGFGDVKLGGVLGAYLGWFGWVYVYYGVFAGFLLGAVIAIALLATRRAGMKTAIPFGPMLVVGPLAVLAFDLVPSLT